MLSVRLENKMETQLENLANATKRPKSFFETLGTGQFRPVENANPTIGTLDTLEVLEEYKIEMICHDNLIYKAVKTLKEVHPYEEVAYEVFKMEDI